MKAFRLKPLGICLFTIFTTASMVQANPNYRLDHRYHHNHYYPRIGLHFTILPQRHHTVRHHNTPYYYYGGIWYGPARSDFVVVTPPIGVFVPVLPPTYTTVWSHGVAYYYANETYYVWRPDRNGYVVTNPPQEIIDKAPPIIADELFVYPKNGQSEQQKADDRYSCHSWAVKQTAYDPTKPPQNMSVSDLNDKREDYQRATKACLEGKGYSVR